MLFRNKSAVSSWKVRVTSLNYVQAYRAGSARELLIRRGVASRLIRVLARWEIFSSGQEAFTMSAGLLLGLWNLVRQEYIKRVGRSSVLSTLRPRAILFCFFSFGLIPWVGDFNFLKAKRRYNQ